MEERASDDVRDALRKQIVFEVCVHRAAAALRRVIVLRGVPRGKAAGQWDSGGGGGEYLRPLAIRDVARRDVCPPPRHIDTIAPPPCHRRRGVAFGGGWRQCGVRRVVVAVSRKQSSALANQQYDIQSLSRVVDGVDKWFDLRGS